MALSPSSVGGDGGNALSELTNGNEGGGDLRARTYAEGGDGPSANTNGGDATARTNVAGGGDVAAEAIAIGGSGGFTVFGPAMGGFGGDALAEASADSTRGDASVRAIAMAGAGGTADGSASLGRVYGRSQAAGDVDVYGEASANGGAISLVNAVDGETSGDLRLEQRATNGSPFAIGGSGGAAQSELDLARASASLELWTAAIAGNGAEGRALSRATNTAGAALASASANGGRAAPSSGATSAAGGAASADAEAVAANGRDASAAATATGGDGASWDGAGIAPAATARGGDATALAESTGVGASVVTSSATALGGAGGTLGAQSAGDGAKGASADASATAVAADGPAAAYAYATGGRGVSTFGAGAGGDGGDANAHAGAASAVSQVFARASAQGGNGGSGATAGGRGGNAILIDAASVTSGGDAWAEQIALAGWGGNGDIGGDGGDAVSAWSGTTGSGDLQLDLNAAGGVGGNGNAQAGGRGGNATVSASVTDMIGAAISISAHATGGNGGSSNAAIGGSGGVGTIAGINAVSTAGGDISIDARQGSGFANFGPLSSGAAPDSILVNGVAADTAGAILVSQSTSSSAISRSELDFTKSSRSLHLLTQAYGETADARTRAENLDGEALADATASAYYARAANADAESIAHTDGVAAVARANTSAYGGQGTSRAVAQHHGDGAVRASAFSGDAADGRAIAIASNAGTSLSEAEALVALGYLGRGDAFSQASGLGVANARSAAYGWDIAGSEVRARSSALGASGTAESRAALPPVGGYDFVYRTCPPPQYFCTEIFPTSALEATAVAHHQGEGDSEAAVSTAGAVLSPTAGTNAWALATASPDAALLASVLAPQSRVATAFANDVDTTALYALIGGQSEQQDSITLDASVSFTPDLASILYAGSRVDSLVLGLVSPSAGASGAGTVRMTVENLGVVVFDQTFGDFATLMTFFDDGVVEISPISNTIALAPLGGVPPLFRVAFEIAFDGADQAFSFGLLVGTTTAPVPEPATLLLAAASLAGLWLVRRRLRSTPYPPRGGRRGA